MSNILNLDDIAPQKVEKVIKLGGAEHQMQTLSVGDFIEQAQKMKEVEEGNFEQELDFFLAMIGKAFPTITKEMIQGLSMSQIEALMMFINEAGEEEGKPAAA